MLSEKERRQLAEIDSQLRAEAPWLQRALGERPHPQMTTLVKLGVSSVLVLAAGLVAVAPWAIIIGGTTATGVALRALFLLEDGQFDRRSSGR